ncbi:hypothetical protein BpHYR1_040131 [Brachionus plicatilis]|uniref:Uncharacterized protein n=1 Tax=Brachionus plicatilis TaxID=10195 RepID=A0A3M7RBS6_BRAPC|nr:hypothetical protein BpHYR1_040131 [Brachionus plicatilis]
MHLRHQIKRIGDFLSQKNMKNLKIKPVLKFSYQNPLFFGHCSRLIFTPFWTGELIMIKNVLFFLFICFVLLVPFWTFYKSTINFNYIGIQKNKKKNRIFFTLNNKK